jgi:hypothetical protein
LGQLPTQEVVRLSILSFIELLRFTTELPTKTVQGLWSELFIILNAKDPISLMRYWHQTPEEKFDFSDGEDKLEVKSTTSDLRIHSFSLEQLNPSPQTQIYIASLILRYYSEGESIEDLRYRLEKLFFDNKELINKLRFQIAQTLGRSITDTFSIKFDVQLAITSLRYFKATDLPRILLTIVPQYVSDVHFKSDLTNIQPTDLSNLTSKSNLINSII